MFIGERTNAQREPRCTAKRQTYSTVKMPTTMTSTTASTAFEPSSWKAGIEEITNETVEMTIEIITTFEMIIARGE